MLSRKGEVIKRFHVSKFSEEDRHSRDPKSEFNQFQKQNKHLLKILGDWTMRYIYENRQELLLSKKYNPYEIGKIALQKFYESIDMQVPEWLTWWITDTSLEELDLGMVFHIIVTMCCVSLNRTIIGLKAKRYQSFAKTS